MAIDVEKMMKETEDLFNKTKQEIEKKEIELAGMKESLVRLQGRYSVYQEIEKEETLVEPSLLCEGK